MSFWEKTEEDEENIEEEEEEFKNVNDRIIFLVDTRAAMLDKNSKGESHLLNCLKVALEVMKTKIIAQDHSSIGITFFGTREKDSNETNEGLFCLLPLAPPSAERIRKLKGFIEDMHEFDRMIGSQLPSKKFTPLKQALWCCSQSFATKDMKKSDFRRIWLFTNDDNPNSHSIMEQKAIVTVARDCFQAGIEISLWHLNPKNELFNPRIFYFQILVADSTKQTGDDDEMESSIDNRMLSGGYDGFDSLMASIRRKEFRKRRLGSTAMSLFSSGTGVRRNSNNGEGEMEAVQGSIQQHIAIHIYKTVQIVKKPPHSWLNAVNNEPLKSSTNYFNSSTGEVLANEQIDTYVDVGGHRVSVAKEEMKLLRKSNNIEGVGIRILYFIPKDSFKDEMNVETPYFLYPDEKRVKGSSSLFESLLRECDRKKVLPVIRFNLTASSLGRIAVLLPQLEVIDENDGCQVVPPGFHVIYLPFAEDIRFNPILETPTAPSLSDKVDEVVSKIIQEMSFPDDFAYSKEIENPALKAYYSVLQAIALNEDELEWKPEADDKLRPSDIVENCCIDVDKLKHLLEYSEDDVIQSSSTSKVGSYFFLILLLFCLSSSLESVPKMMMEKLNLPLKRRKVLTWMKKKVVLIQLMKLKH
jgi:ATP-dependent DNA helicase 2 subunit 1